MDMKMSSKFVYVIMVDRERFNCMYTNLDMKMSSKFVYMQGKVSRATIIIGSALELGTAYMSGYGNRVIELDGLYW